MSHLNPRAINALLPYTTLPQEGAWHWYCHACGMDGVMDQHEGLDGVTVARSRHSCPEGGESQVVAWRE